MTLDDILARCDDVGECLLWRGSCNKTSGIPMVSLSFSQRGVSARRAVYEMSGREIPRGHCVWPKCGNRLCLHPEHLIAGSRKQLGRHLRAQGRTRTPAVLAKCARNGRVNARLSVEIAREIRISTASSQELADRYGVNKSTINNVRRGESWRETVRGASVFSMTY